MFTKIEDKGRLAWLGLVTLLLFVSVTGCIWQSFTTLTQHGVHVGWHEPRVLPIILDAAYVAALAAYIRRPDGFTLGASAIAAAATSAGNALAYLYDPASAYLVAPMPVIIATGVVPPVFAFGIAHFIVHEREKAKSDAAGDDESAPGESGGSAGGNSADAGSDAGKRRVAQRTAKRAPAEKVGAADGVRPARTPSAGDLERARRVRDNQWETVTIPELQGLLGCSYVPAQRARALAKNGALAE